MKFKEFLKEQNTSSNPVFRIFICFIDSSGLKNPQKFTESFNEELVDKISKKVDPRIKVDEIYKAAIAYEIELNESIANDYDLLNNIHNNLIVEWDMTLKNSTYSVDDTKATFSQIICQTTPLYKIDYDIISFILNDKISFSGIGKTIGEHCKDLYINYPFLITDSVLGLLKLPKNTKIICHQYDIWWKIISKYLASRDILACHEELVDNGLEEYAKM